MYVKAWPGARQGATRGERPGNGPSIEQFGVASGAHQDQLGLGHSVEQEPVRLNMAVTVPREVAALLLNPPQVLFKGGCGEQREGR